VDDNFIKNIGRRNVVFGYYPRKPRSPILESIEALSGGSDLDLLVKNREGRRRREARR
jgi:hypothetical protein